MLRGIDRQQIFEDSEDYLRFIDVLQEGTRERFSVLTIWKRNGGDKGTVLLSPDSSCATVLAAVTGKPF